jgi:hypothetical protein
MKVVVALVAPAVLAAALAIWSASVVGSTPPEPPLSRSTVLWADRLFTDADDLAAWLNSRGASYRTWAERHPRAAARQRSRRG